MIPSNLNPLGITVNENLPLTLTAEQAGSTVQLTKTGSPTVSGLHYRLGKSGAWLAYTIGTTITLTNVGDCVQFWNSAESLGLSSSHYVQFVMTGAIKAQGNTQSLLNYLSYCKNYCFYRMYSGCTALIQSSEFPAMTLAEGCYGYSHYGCTGLTEMPLFPAMTLARSCYNQAFRGCSNLQTVKKLPATTLAYAAYYAMFYNCSSLANVPDKIPALSLPEQCCNTMFYSCSSLQSAPRICAVSLASNSLSAAFRYATSLAQVEVDFTDWFDGATTDWMSGARSSGTFIKPTDLPEEYGNSRIRSGWTVVNK